MLSTPHRCLDRPLSYQHTTKTGFDTGIDDYRDASKKGVRCKSAGDRRLPYGLDVDRPG